MTRAKKRLYLIHATSRIWHGGVMANEPSRFLLNIPENLVDIKGMSIRNRKLDNSLKANTWQEDSWQKTEDGSEDGNWKSEDRNDMSRVLGTIGDKPKLVAGDKVEHKVFGEGVVVSIGGNIASIAFVGKGIKKLDVTIAPLKKIN